MQKKQLLQFLDTLLKPEEFKDYCPNGLQVEGTENIKTIVSGVSACQALIDKAIELKADAILVHHGFFWKGESPVLTGMKARRIKHLMQNNINLIAYHLPLDCHKQFGNNIQLAKLLNFKDLKSFSVDGQQDLLWTGKVEKNFSPEAFNELISQKLKRKPLIEWTNTNIKNIAWCTGAAQDFIFQAIDLGCDTFITGEVSERTIHIARENQINFVAAGHHATERYGVKALGTHLAETFSLAHFFIDIDNPV